jgi:phytoene dehydrogenase-like protein
MTTLDRAAPPRPKNEPRSEQYDVVVVGGGIGGLTAGALLARAGKNVLVVDANDRPGGYARSITAGPYTFDTADHLILGCAPTGPFGPGLIDAVLRHLGVRNRCDFVRVDNPFYSVHFPDFAMAVPGGRERYLEALLHEFPGQAPGLRHLLDLGEQIAREIAHAPIATNVFDLLRTPWRYPTAFRYRNATVQQVIDAELTEPRLGSVYSALWYWLALQPSRASFLAWSYMMAHCIEDAAYYCRGSFQQLADALAEGLTLSGGELSLGARVTRILARGRCVYGVVLENGRCIQTPLVISNADARDTFGRLVDPEQVPASYRRRLQAMRVSNCTLGLYIATDLDVRALGAHHETVVASTWDIGRMYTAGLAGDVLGLDVLIPTITDSSLAPPGEHIVILKPSVAPTWNGVAPVEQDRFAERMLTLAEVVLPGLRQHLTHVEGAGPGVPTRFPLQRLGPVGWALEPRQTGIGRLPQRTPVAGVYLAGQWTQPGSGVGTVVDSSVRVARMVLGVAPHAPALPLRLPITASP